MKKLALVLSLSVLLSGLSAVYGMVWMTDLTKALTKAKDANKLVLMDFTGSDWCPPCIALHNNVLISKEFESFAKTNLVLVQVDFPKTKVLTKAQQAINRQLAERFKVTGYPTVIVLSSEGKVLQKKVGYGGATAAEFIAEIKSLKR